MCFDKREFVRKTCVNHIEMIRKMCYTNINGSKVGDLLEPQCNQGAYKVEIQ